MLAVLIVDSNREALASLAYQFVRRSYPVRTASTAGEAIEAIRSSPPCMVVLSHELPDSPGLFVLQAIRHVPETYFLPVMMLMRAEQAEDRIRALEAGADAAMVWRDLVDEVMTRPEVPDLIILDLMLPGMSGQEVLRELRCRSESNVPVIVLTARTEERDRVEGLQLGADDYITKPFSPQELVLRVGAVLRRVQQAPPSDGSGKVLRVGPFEVDVEAARAEVDGRALGLTRTEFRLLCVLMERRGRVQSRRQLLESVWDVTAQITTRTVDMHILRLRNKSGVEGEWIETVRGFG